MALTNKEIYNNENTLASHLANLKDGQRGVITDTPAAYFNNNFLYKYNGNHYLTAVSKYYDGVSWNLVDVEFGKTKSTLLADAFVTSGIALGESGNLALSGFTNTSIVGALNELKGEVGGGSSKWNRVEVIVNEEYLIPDAGVGVSVGVHVGSGLTDDGFNDYMLMSQTGDIALRSWFGTKNTILGAFNKLSDNIVSSSARSINGFYNRTDSDLVWTRGSRLFKIITESQYSFFSNNIEYTKILTDTNEVTIPDTTGYHYIYFDDDGVIQQTTTFDINIIVRWAFITAIYWDSTAAKEYFVHDERHGFEMSSATHLYNHATFHTRYEDDGGLAISDMIVGGNGGLDAHAQFAFTNGIIWDEDIRFAVANTAEQSLIFPAEIPVMHISGVAWQKDVATTFPVKRFGTGRLAYNENVGGVWQQTEVTNNDYVLMHYYATTDIFEPMIAIQGQNDYATLADAQAGAETEIFTIEINTLNLNEYKAIATVIFITGNGLSNTVKAAVVTAELGDYYDWRLLSVSASGTGVTSNFWQRDAINGYTYTTNIGDKVGVGTITPFYDITVIRDTNIETRINIQNLTNGVSVAPRFVCQSNGSNSMMIGCASSTFSAETEWQDKAFISAEKDGLVVVASNAVGTIDWYTGGTASGNKRMTLDEDGNLGIGILNPIYALQVERSIPTFYVSAFQNINSAGYGVLIDGGDTVEHALRVRNYNGTKELLFVRGNGYVGIGKSDPEMYMDIEANAPSNWIARMKNTSSTLPFGLQIISPASDGARFLLACSNTGTNDLLALKDNGRLGVGTNAPDHRVQVIENLTAAFASSIINSSATGKGLRIDGGSTASEEALLVRTYNGGTDLLKILGNGDVNTIPWTDYSATTTLDGFVTTSTVKVFYKIIGKIAFVRFYLDGAGGGANGQRLTFTVPFTPNTDSAWGFGLHPARDGAVATQCMSSYLGSPNAIILALGSDPDDINSLVGWTGGGAEKHAAGSFWCEIV